MSSVKRIVRNELCIGCGACEALGSSAGYSMRLSGNGFYYPEIPETGNKQADNSISSVCPGINIINSESVWGDLSAAYTAWAADEEIRSKGSSGGVISALCIYLLDKGSVDGILHVGRDEGHYLNNLMTVSRSRDEVIKKASSRYAPTVIFDRIFQILDDNPDDSYCFVGKPCDIQTLKLLLNERPQYGDRIKFGIALFCAGIPSFNATEQLISEANEEMPPSHVVYRGDGWPGYFKAVYPNGNEFRKSYSDSWGKVLGRQINFRCKICLDGIGLQADIAVGDAWETKDGYPDFEERPGRSFVLVRNDQGKALFEAAVKESYIVPETLDIEKLREMQPYQYGKRTESAYKIVPVNIMSGGIIRTKNLFSLKSGLPLSRSVKISLGALKRSFKRNRY